MWSQCLSYILGNVVRTHASRTRIHKISLCCCPSEVRIMSKRKERRRLGKRIYCTKELLKQRDWEICACECVRAYKENCINDDTVLLRMRECVCVRRTQCGMFSKEHTGSYRWGEAENQRDIKLLLPLDCSCQCLLYILALCYFSVFYARRISFFLFSVYAYNA